MSDSLISDACWLLFRVTRDDSYVPEFVNSFTTAIIVRQLSSTNPGVVLPAVKTVANILTQDDSQFIDFVLFNRALDHFGELLLSDKGEIIQEIAFSCYNISQGSDKNFLDLLQHQFVWPRLIKHIGTQDSKTVKECLLLVQAVLSKEGQANTVL